MAAAGLRSAGQGLAPKGRARIAQGNALGKGTHRRPRALKGRQSRGGSWALAPFQGSRGARRRDSQGVALGYFGAPRLLIGPALTPEGWLLPQTPDHGAMPAHQGRKGNFVPAA
jgi:hypothetical protein